MLCPISQRYPSSKQLLVLRDAMKADLEEECMRHFSSFLSSFSCTAPNDPFSPLLLGARATGFFEKIYGFWVDLNTEMMLLWVTEASGTGDKSSIAHRLNSYTAWRLWEGSHSFIALHHVLYILKERSKHDWKMNLSRASTRLVGRSTIVLFSAPHIQGRWIIGESKSLYPRLFLPLSEETGNWKLRRSRS